MKLAYVIIGTRGDLIPFISSAKYALLKGHDAIIYCTKDLEAFVSDYDVPVSSLGDFDTKSWVKNFFQYGIGTDLSKFMENCFFLLQNSKPDIIICGVCTLFCVPLALHLESKVILFNLSPFAPSHQYFCPAMDCSILEVEKTDTNFINKDIELIKRSVSQDSTNLSGVQNFFSHVLWLDFYFSEQAFCNSPIMKRLGFNSKDFFNSLNSGYLKILNCFSSYMFPFNVEPSQKMQFLGSLKISNPDLKLNPVPNSFLEQKPIYVGFGSMSFSCIPTIITLFVDSLLDHGEKILLCSGWSDKFDQYRSNSNVYISNEMDHQIIFPRVKAAIYHGGVGTFQEVVHAKIPSLVIPFIFDQLLNGTTSSNLNFGPTPLIYNHCNYVTVSSKVDDLLAKLNFYKQNLLKFDFKESENNLDQALQEITAIFASNNTISDFESNFFDLGVHSDLEDRKLVFFYFHLLKNRVKEHEYTEISNYFIKLRIITEQPENKSDMIQLFEEACGIFYDPLTGNCNIKVKNKSHK